LSWTASLLGWCGKHGTKRKQINAQGQLSFQPVAAKLFVRLNDSREGRQWQNGGLEESPNNRQAEHGVTDESCRGHFDSLPEAATASGDREKPLGSHSAGKGEAEPCFNSLDHEGVKLCKLVPSPLGRNCPEEEVEFGQSQAAPEQEELQLGIPKLPEPFQQSANFLNPLTDDALAELRLPERGPENHNPVGGEPLYPVRQPWRIPRARRVNLAFSNINLQPQCRTGLLENSPGRFHVVFTSNHGAVVQIPRDDSIFRKGSPQAFACWEQGQGEKEGAEWVALLHST
jgi:hypothetical protein